MSIHCASNSKDRILGRYWEERFCEMAEMLRFSFTPMQINNHQGAAIAHSTKKIHLLPDVTVWTAPGQHHEIKHKNPTQYGCFGLEVYRFEALIWFARETQQDVMYTIHNHDLTAGRNDPTNDLNHWLTANILDLQGKWTYESDGCTYVNGITRIKPIYYWPTTLWQPLANYWLSILQLAL